MRRVSDETTKPRECGPCTACCTAEGVHELHKAPGDPCEYVCSRGCGIYERRPASCRDFRCLWLEGVFAPDARPDALQVVFSMAPASVDMHPWRRFLRAMEVVPGAALRPACQEAIRWLTSKGEIVWVHPFCGGRPGVDVHIHYPDGATQTIDPGFTFEQHLAQIEAMRQGATWREAHARFPATPHPPPRPARDWMRDRDARRTIERARPVPAIQRIFELASRAHRATDTPETGR